MTDHENGVHEVNINLRLSPEEKEKRKQLVLTQGSPSITRSIADAVVVKNEDYYFLTEADGTVPLGGNHGFGLYYHDCRYLNGYQIKIGNADPNVLVSNAISGFSAVIELTNREIQVEEGEHIPLDQIGVKWERILDAGKCTLFDWLKLKNYGQEGVRFPLSLTFQANFEDVFAIRGLLPIQTGQLRPPAWKDGVLHFRYDGADGLYRNLSVQFSPKPDRTEDTTAHFDINLQARDTKQILISLIVSEGSDENKLKLKAQEQVTSSDIEAYFQNISQEWLRDQTYVHTDSLLLNEILGRSLGDLRMLRTNIHEKDFFAAGVPWFVTLFGRDSLITSLQTLAFNPYIAEETLHLLASYQAHETDGWRDAQPGKILHELRIGELAKLGEIPHTPYYGTVDATPLFLILIAQHAAWTGKLDLFHKLRDNIQLALNWIDQYGDTNGDGYVEYHSTSTHGLINQGWKDSGNAIINADGSLADPPIALIEVQGYIYWAKIGMAELYRRAGEPDRADQLLRDAEKLRERFNRDYWSEELGTYVLALQKGGKPAAVVSSNPGHALWSKIADREKARQTVNRLMAEDMFNGWGVRTLSSNEKGYNPTGYHLGTVWPHDNALIAAGFRQYGFDTEAHKIYLGILDAAMRFENYRLPELFCGFPQKEYRVPVHYPVACHPQAWAAASVPYLLTVFLGLEPEAFEHRLRIIRPTLPDYVDRVQVRRLRVGEAWIDLNFNRTPEGRTAVDVVKVDGDLDVIVGNDYIEKDPLSSSQE